MIGRVDGVSDRILVVFIVPVGKSDVLAQSQSVKIPVVYLMVLLHQPFILFHAGMYLLGDAIGLYAVLPCVQMILGRENPHFHQICCGAGGIIQKRYEGAHMVLRAAQQQLLALLQQIIGNPQHLIGFSVMHRMEYPVIHHLVSALGKEPGILPDHSVNHLFLPGVIHCSELPVHPLPGVLLRHSTVPAAPRFDVIRKIQKIRKPQLLRPDVTDIGHPDFPDAVVIGHGHFFANLRKIRRSDPLEGMGTAVHIHVVVHSVAAVVIPHCLRRQRSCGAVVVVAEH